MQPPQPHFITGPGYYHPPMLVQAPPPLLLPSVPVKIPQQGFIPAPPHQAFPGAPIQAQTTASYVHPGFVPPGSYPPHLGGHTHESGVHSAHPSVFQNTPVASYHREPRNPSLGQRILRAFRMPSGRASTVASSRSPSPNRGRSRRRRSSPGTRRSSRRRSTRSARRRAPTSPPPPQMSPGSSRATVHSDDYVVERGHRRSKYHRDIVDDVSSLSSEDGDAPNDRQATQSNVAVRQTPEMARPSSERQADIDENIRR